MTNQSLINPNPKRAAIIARQDFRALARLAFWGEKGSIAEGLASVMGKSSRSVERWLSPDETKQNAPKDAIEACLNQITQNQKTQSEFIAKIKAKLGAQ